MSVVRIALSECSWQSVTRDTSGEILVYQWLFLSTRIDCWCDLITCKRKRYYLHAKCTYEWITSLLSVLAKCNTGLRNQLDTERKRIYRPKRTHSTSGPLYSSYSPGKTLDKNFCIASQTSSLHTVLSISYRSSSTEAPSPPVVFTGAGLAAEALDAGPLGLRDDV